MRFKRQKVLFNQWIDQNRLRINRVKCEVIVFGRGYTNQHLIPDKMLPYLNVCKNLGVYMYKMFRFREHIDDVRKSSIGFAAYYIRHLYTQKSLLLFCNSFVKSRIGNGLLKWGSAAKKLVEI